MTAIQDRDALAGVPTPPEAPHDETAGGVGFAAWLALAVLLLFGFLGFLDRQVISLMVDLVKHDLRLTDTQMGILQGPAFGLSVPLFAIPFGYAADRFSRRWVIFVGVVAWSMAAAASGLAHDFNSLLFARIAVAIGEAALMPATASLLADLFPRHRLALVFSILATGSILGQAFALGLGGAIIGWAGAGVAMPVLGNLHAWQITFIVTGLPGAILAFLAFAIRETRERVAVPAPLAPWGDVFRFMLRNWLFLICNIVGFSSLLIVTWGLLAWTPAALARHYGWSIAAIGGSLALYTVILGPVGQLANGAIVDRMFGRGLKDAHLLYYVVAVVVMTLSAVIAPYAASVMLYLAILGPSKMLMQYGGVSSASLQVITPSAIRGRLAALVGIVSSVVGGSFGPLIMPLLNDAFFHDPAKMIFTLGWSHAIFLPIAGLLFWIGRKPMREAVMRIIAAEQSA